MEPGLVTLAKIIGTLMFGMSIIPLLFLFSQGEMGEPAENFDPDQ
jgi:hypothetical protein